MLEYIPFLMAYPEQRTAPAPLMRIQFVWYRFQLAATRGDPSTYEELLSKNQQHYGICSREADRERVLYSDEWALPIY